MNWRQWAFTKLQSTTSFPVLAGGSIVGPLEDLPAIVYRIQAVTPRLRDDDVAIAEDRILEVWAYDSVGSYDRIDSTLSILRVALVGPVEEAGGVCCRWIGDSAEFADEGLKAITRNSSFQLIGATS